MCTVLWDGSLPLNIKNEMWQLLNPCYVFWNLFTGSCFGPIILKPSGVPSYWSIIFCLRNSLITASKNVRQGGCPFSVISSFWVSCGCSLSSCWNSRMRGVQLMWYGHAAILLLSECWCCLAASSAVLSCYWFYFCHICHWPSMLAIRPACALVCLGVLSCRLVSVHADLSLCISAL